MPSAPLAIGSQSRKKRQEFHFRDDHQVPSHDKENPASLHLHDDETNKSLPNTSQNQLKSMKDCPQTPAAKIAFADLVGNGEEIFGNALLNATPEDHVFWRNGPRSSDPTSSIPITQRGKKRARSSSPPSSQNEKSAHFATSKQPLDLQPLQQSLQTPQNDPATDLWARYSTGSHLKPGEKGAPLPAFAHLINSSPQTPNTTNSKDSGLRRSISCGIEWPTSKAKRRRVDVEEPHNRVRDILDSSKKEILGQENSKISRVSLLVDKIQESLFRKADREPVGPSSSSPLPERSDRQRDLYTSPLSKKLARHPIEKHGVQMQTSVQPEQGAVDDSVATKPEDGSSSEFGDPDLDQDLLHTIDVEESRMTGAVAATNVRMDIKVTFAEPHAQADAAMELRANNLNEDFKASGGNEAEVQAQASDDEFGSEDDAAFASELQGVAEEFESSMGIQPSRQLKPPPLIQHSDTALDNNMQVEALDIHDDDFDDDDDELFRELGDKAFRSQHVARVGSTSQVAIDNRAIKRYLVVDVFDSTYENAQGRKRQEKILSIKDEKTRLLKIVCLRQSWLESRCTKGSYIHLIGNFDNAGQCIVDDADNMIILHPDHLISATVVADSFTCTRRAVLQDRVKATGRAEQSQVYGHILHEVFGQALEANDWRLERLQTITKNVVASYVEPLYEINVPVHEAIAYLESKMPELIAWAAVFVSAKPGAEALMHDRHGAFASMSINKLLEVEEHIWSPMYGLKGNIDATVQVVFEPADGSTSRIMTVPLEFKTGKKDNNEMHRAQTQLYTLLLSDRYDINVTNGVLYYLETSKTFRVEGLRNEIRHMIIQRNELACFVRNKLELPPMIQKPHSCKNCYAQTPCFIYHRLVEDGNGETSGLKELFDQAMGHLTSSHKAFFRKWDDLLTKEERDAMKFRRELWTMLSTEREALGRCFSNVIIEPGSAVENMKGPKINRFQYTFVKSAVTPNFSFTDSQLITGEPIVISDEKGHFALANGYITNVRSSRITVSVDRRLQNARKRTPGFDPDINQSFVGTMDVCKAKDVQFTPAADSQQDMRYRIDKDEFSNGMATARNNIIRMMEKDLFQARALRQLIIEGAAPSFKPVCTAYTLSGPASQRDLNVDQQRAIEKVMSAKDYALVLGMPGTGKTTTIAHIIRALVSQGKSVLLTSYTHTAVDNILLKIKDDKIPILRLGAVGKVHPEVQAFADLGGVPKKTFAELEDSYVNSKVVATTCLGINQAIFNARVFDYCIVDEASQITLPVCLGPIRMARTFVLVGDHYQLPPLVQNKEAREGGLDISLFKLLSESQPSSVVNLEHQYRMAEDIMMLSNELIYSGRLKCGTSAVANQLLEIPNLEGGLEAHHHTTGSLARSGLSQADVCNGTSPCWLGQALLPATRCLFLNTDTISRGHAQDTASGGSRITNHGEAILVIQLVTTLIRAGVSPRAIGVITFYRSQLALLRQELKAIAGTTAAAEVEMHTADKFQGRDKEVVVLSCVRSNDSHTIGELLKDWRRVNVAITRARSKLLIVGSKSTLGQSGNDVLHGLVQLVEGKGWMYDLPVHALDDHAFANGSQFSSRLRGGALDKASPLKEPSQHVKVAGRSPSRSQSPTKRNTFRKPRKMIQGTIDMDKLIEMRPVLRDIVNGM